MASSKLVTLDANHVLEFINTNVAASMTDEPLHLHEVDDGIQLINGDDTDHNNKRDYSYYAEVGGTTTNYRLAITPLSYSDIDSDYHDSVKYQFDYGDGLEDPSLLLEYKKVRLYSSNGFAWDTDIIGEALEIYIEYGDRLIRLLNFFDARDASNYLPAATSLHYNNRIFSSCIEFYIVDFESILENDADEAVDLRHKLLDVTDDDDIDYANLSSYLFNYNSILADDYVEVSLTGDNTGGVSYPFETFVGYDWNHAFMLRAEYADGLHNIIDINSDNQLVIGLDHDTTTVLAALSQISDIDDILITHSLSITEFDSSADNLGTRKLMLQNPDSQYADIEFLPIIQDETESITVQLRTIISFTDTDTEINKYLTVYYLLEDVNKLRNNIDLSGIELTSTEIVNQIETTTVQLSSSNSLAKDISLSFSQRIEYINITTVYVDDEEQQIDTLTIPLSKTKRSLRIKFMQDSASVDLSTNNKLYFVVGDARFEEVARPSANIVQFQAANESTDVKTFSIVNEKGLLLAEGAISSFDDIADSLARTAVAEAATEAAEAEAAQALAETKAFEQIEALATAQGNVRNLLLDKATITKLSELISSSS